ncbi:sortilin isoform X2 [Microcaecilia unicolor]|uniref:Sortilin n=1 Tax=Microcaecilia unicolor TaxID=1415580 RepID=A0A6P7ZV14_9AMPH|nr:sortilin isoform X2 [Microcaecilia unicolor]
MGAASLSAVLLLLAGVGALALRDPRDSEPSLVEGCDPWQTYKASLDNNTHKYSFHDLGGSVLLSWVGSGTGVILVLTTFRVPLPIITFGQSKLYRSDNYGKNFTDITSLINNTLIITEFGMAIGPQNSGKVILTGDVVGRSSGGRIFRSSSFAKDFTQTDLPFHPNTQIMYDPKNSDHLLVLSSENSLWLSRNFGEKWEKIHQTVCLAKWGSDATIFFIVSLNGSCKSDFGLRELKRTNNFGRNFKTVASRVYSFGLGGPFLYASVMTEMGSTRRIYVSLDHGDTWNMAQLPSVGEEQFYSILAATDDMVFMHVDEPGDTGYGTIYTSDDRGIIYSKSLERHLYTDKGDTDFTTVGSLRGVYMTSVLSEDNSIQSVISFDQGGEWKPLKKPENSKCESTAKYKEECSLHIHAWYSLSQNPNVPMLPLSEPSAVGIIIAHGSVGDAISVMNPDVYISDDGGYTWIRTLEGPHHYAILDSGGLIVAVEKSYNPISVIKFSTDEGQCWYTYNFTKEPFIFTGLATEPGARSMNVSIWGFQQFLMYKFWVSYTINFKDLLTRPCESKDYVMWLAHSSDPNDPSDGCILGYKEQYLRLRKSSVCQNGQGYRVSKQPTVCSCTLDDFLCDFGYYRPENDSQCIEQPELKGHDLEFCLYGEEELLKTNGYRKIPGDKCDGGANPKHELMDLKKKCTGDSLAQEAAVHQDLIPIILSVVAVLLISIVAGVLIIKKYVCGGRFLVHRYSVLQQHVEANGVEALDTSITSGSKRLGYHDDSDEDLLE